VAYKKVLDFGLRICTEHVEEVNWRMQENAKNGAPFFNTFLHPPIDPIHMFSCTITQTKIMKDEISLDLT
jgi:hypothetical protein